MDKNLANYLFHTETLYFSKEDLALAAPKKEVSEINKPDSKPEIKIPAAPKSAAQIPVVNIPSVNELTPTPEVRESLEQIEAFKMSTSHLVVVNGIKTEERDFLVKVLLALNMSLAKVDVLDTTIYDNPDFKEIIYNNSIASILFLGEEAGGDFLPKLKLTPYEVKDIKSIKFLSSASLSEVSLNQNNEKRLLWESLKSLYSN